MKSLVDFKTDRIKEEWENSKLKDRLRNYILIIALYSWTEFGKRIVITSIWRSKEEEEKLKSSGIHNAWRGIDLRTSIYNEDEINKIVKLCDSFHYDARNLSKVCIYGDKRHLDHIHVQIGWRT